MSTNEPEPISDLTPFRGPQGQGLSEEFLESLEPDLLLAYFVESAMPLSEEDQARFDAELAKEENRYVRELLARLHEAIGQTRDAS